MKHLFTFSERLKGRWESFATFAIFASAFFCKFVKLVNLVSLKSLKSLMQFFAESAKVSKCHDIFASRGVKDVRVSLDKVPTNHQRISNLSPTVDRYLTRVAAVFTLVFVLGVGNVWGADVTYTLTINGSDFNTTSYAANNNEKTTDAVCTTDNKKTYEVSWTSNQVMKNGNNMQWQKSKGYIYNSTDLGTISSVTVNSSAGSFTTYYGTSEQPSSGSAGSGKGYFKTSVGGATGTTSSIIVTFVISEGGGGSSEPSVSASPEAVNNVVAAGVNNQSISLSYENISGYTTEVSVHPNADGTGTLSPAWLSASISSPYSTVSYTVSANNGAARTAYIKVHATASGNKEATTIIPVSQVKYTEPTGTFAAFTGSIVEGDYLIVYDNGAINTTSDNSSRMQFLPVTPQSNKVTNPDESIIWHIAPSGDYWTIYNAAENKYLAATGTKSQATLNADGTDNKSLWTVTGTSTYEFVNKNNSTNNVNANLRKNGTYGFACYASGTGGALTLYKKALPTHKVTFTAAPTGGTVAVSVGGSSINTNADVEEGNTVTITPTPSAYYSIASVTKGGQAVTPEQGVYSFTMPASDVAIVVTFEYIPVTSVTLNKNALELVEGATETLSVTSVLPNTARNTVTWSSTDETVATVTNAGVVSALKAGSTTIKATSTVSTSVFGSCALTVTAPSGNPITLLQNEGGTVTASVDVSDVIKETSVTLTATPEEGYSVSGWTVLDGNADEITPTAQTANTFTFSMPDGEVTAEASFTHEEAVLKLHDAAGVTTYDEGNDHFWKESVTLPSTAAACSKVFMGWSADENRATAPELAKGASYTIPNKETNHLYAVYATIDNDDVTITPSAVSDGDDPHTITIDQAGYTLSANKNTGSTAPTWNSTASDVRIYAKGDITLTSSKTMKSIVFNISTQGLKRLAPITASVGTIATQTSGDETMTWTGSATSVTFTVGDQAEYGSDGASKAGQLDFSTIDVVAEGDPSDYSTTCAQQVAAPTFSPEAGMYTTAQTIHISAADGATIYYTTDGSKPSTGSAVFSADIELNTRAITTIKAIAAKEGYANSNVASATYNINLPFTVAEAIALIPNNKDERANTYIDGIVCTAGTEVSDGTMLYYISDDGTETSRIQIYYGKGLNNEDFSATTDLKVGDKVRVFGKLNNFNGSYDMDDSYLTSLEVASVSSVAISGTAKTTYSAEDNSFSFAGLTATATYNTGYVKDVTNEAGVWSTNLSENIVTEAGDVTVTATFGGKSDTKVVTVTYTSKTVESISLSYSAKTVYVGAECPEPVVTAIYEEDIDDEDVSDLATFDKSAYVANTAGTYTINVSYQGKNASYDVTVKAIANDQATAYTAEEINDIIVNAYKSATASTYNVYVKGIVVENAYTMSGNSVYHISADGTTTNQFYIYGAKYFDPSTSATGNVKAGDDVIVKGNIQYYNSTTPELKSSTVVYQLREGALTVNNVAEFEVGTADLAEADLTINRNGSTGAITFSCEANDALEIVDNKLRAKGNATADVTVTATMAADNTEGKINFTGASTTFTVHVIPAKVRYAVTFDLDGGSADPEMSLGGQLENANVVIPDGTFTKDGYKFNGWVVKETVSENPVEVTETAGVYSFTMPAAAVTVTAQWLEGSELNWVAATWASNNDITSNTNLEDDYATIAVDANISLIWNKATGNNVPAYNSGNTEVRLYQNTTLQVAGAEGKLIKKVTFTFRSTNTGTLTASVGTYSSNEWSGLANAITFTNTGTAAYIKSIALEYINGTVTTLSIANVSLMLTAGTKDLSISCNVTPTPAISYEIAEADQAIATVADGVVTAHSIGGPINVTASIAQGENYTAAIANFTITVTDKTPTQMSFPQVSYDAYLGSDFVEPVLTTDPEGIAVTYSSSVPGVATVDEATGVITLVGEGTTVITAAFAGNDDYSANSATYTLNVIDPYTDVLTNAKIGASTSYTDWEKSFSLHGTTYAGNTTTGTSEKAGTIQMRTSNGSGIVSTSAIGYLKSVSATETQNGTNTLQIYAKSTAYESPADLHDANKRGTLIGTIGADGGTMVFETGKAYSDNYKYIGIKANGGGVNYDDITITWTPAVFASFDVTYQAGEGTGTDVEESIEEGSIISLAANTFTAPEGKIFAGWLLEGEENVREAGSKYTVTAAATFTAQWISVFTITYKPGEAEGEDVTVNDVPAGDYELAENTFVAPANKEFAGWKLNNEGESLAAGANYNVTGNAVFTAQWSIIKQAADLAYTTTSYIITRGQSFEAPELTNPHSLAVTYSGNNDEVATVNATTGAITLQGGIGEVTVTATFEANDYYYAGEASYTLKVKDANLAGGWIRLTSANDLMDGMKVIIAEYVTSGTAINAMGAQNTNNRAQVAGTLAESKLVADEEMAIFTLVAVGDNFAFKGADGKYLYAASSNKNYLRSQATIDGDATWSISISSGNATITAQGDNSNKVMRYNSTNDLFSCYASVENQNDIALYSKTVSVSGETDASTLDEYADVIVPNGATLVVDDNENTTILGEITVQNGATVTVNSATNTGNINVKEGATVTVNEETHADNITVENGATIEVGATTAANNLVIQTTSGSTEKQGKSGQLTGSVMPVVSGDLFIEIKLCEGAMDADASRKWYCISAPFNVNMNGGFFWGDGTPMVLNTDFQLFEWDGDRRATGISGWKRVSGVMKAGIAYFIGFDDERSNQNIIKLKATNKTISNKSKINAPEHSSSVDNKYANWNGLANPNFRHIALNKDVQAFDYNVQSYTTYAYGDYNFVVGTPFFIKETGDITIGDATHGHFRAPKREVEQLSYCVRIVREGKAGFDNQMYVRASEEASTSYEEGHDLVTMNAETSNYGALLWTVNYGGKRLAIEEAPLVNDKASYALSLYAPADGAYRIETPTVREDASLYLTYEGNIIWDLTAGAYELDLNKGATEGYGLMLVRKAPQVTTGVENVQGDKTQCTKVILNDHVYILRDAQLYDVTGKAVK